VPGEIVEHQAHAIGHAAVLLADRGGHGAVAEGPEVAARLAADHAYIDALRRGEDPVDARLGPDSDWLPVHQSNLELARGR
jgi:hypothetical protein